MQFKNSGLLTAVQHLHNCDPQQTADSIYTVTNILPWVTASVSANHH